MSELCGCPYCVIKRRVEKLEDPCRRPMEENLCLDCGETVDTSDLRNDHTTLLHEDMTVETRWRHAECAVRNLVGSVACQQGKCARLGGPGCGDDPALSQRDAAIAAYQYFRLHSGGEAEPVS